MVFLSHLHEDGINDDSSLCCLAPARITNVSEDVKSENHWKGILYISSVHFLERLSEP